MKKIIGFTALLLVGIFAAAIVVLKVNQKKIVQNIIQSANEDFYGMVVLEDSDISFFANFPYISIDLKGLSIFENKNLTAEPILRANDTYVGFDLLSLFSGNFEIKKIKVVGGFAHIVQDSTNQMNILKAFEPLKPVDDIQDDFNLYLKKIELYNFYLEKLALEDSTKIAAFFNDASARFKSKQGIMEAGIDTRFVLNIIKKQDTTFIKNKNLEIHGAVNYLEAEQLLTLKPSELRIEKGVFGIEGSIDIDNDFELDLKVKGQKPNFDLLIAFAPEEINPILAGFRNQGEVFFDAVLKGKSINGNIPFFEANFGCKNGYFANKETEKVLDELSFKGYFTNGSAGTPETMQFSIKEFSARPEEGIFSGNLTVTNFNSPEIETQLKSDFELDFLAQFLNVEQLRNLTGKVALTMNFRDIIDLQNPEKSIEKLNESYFTELEVKNLGFVIPNYKIPISNINIKAVMDGNEALIEQFTMRVGSSDISIKGSVSDLPAVLHHTNAPVTTKISVRAKKLNFTELTHRDNQQFIEAVEEVVHNLSLQLAFTSSAKELTEYQYLPTGTFSIERFNAKLEKYPHAFHDFFAKFSITDQKIDILNFKGEIDDSQFAFNGFLENYHHFISDKPRGKSTLTLVADAKLLKLKDLLSYDTLNLMPEEYREEELSNVKLNSKVIFSFADSLVAYDVLLNQFQAKLLVHPLKLEQFKGKVHVENEQLTVQEFSGIMGQSKLTVSLDYHLGNNPLAAKNNKLVLNSPNLNFDELLSYNRDEAEKPKTKEEHENAYNIFEAPFPNLQVVANIANLNYHQYKIQNFKVRGKITENHYVNLDTLGMQVAGGELSIKGYFNGEDPKNIYFNPNITAKGIDLDQMLFKFSNFGQDHLVSENLHGKLTGNLSGKLKMYPDMVPDLDNSSLTIKAQIVNGSLENYEPLNAMSAYFADKNLAKVRFDTLANTLTFNNGILRIPSMTIASSLGYIELSGRQDMNMNMEYFFRVPWRMVTNVAGKKLFGKSPDEVDPDQLDAVVVRDNNRRTRFVNLKMSGTPDDFKISLGKDKESRKAN
ncbi:MAG: hypothetical protein ACXITV_05720 [Luteibaculaceae bacterium]